MVHEDLQPGQQAEKPVAWLDKPQEVGAAAAGGAKLLAGRQGVGRPAKLPKPEVPARVDVAVAGVEVPFSVAACCVSRVRVEEADVPDQQAVKPRREGRGV